MTMAEKIQSLYQQYGELDGISIECQKELIAIGVVNKAARAEIFLQGAQITGYQPHGKKPVLFLSEQCQYQEGTSLRGGIPICWPWFGDVRKNDESIQQQLVDIASISAHGFVRDKEWLLTDIHIQNDALTVLTLEYDIDPQTYPAWPFSARLSYTISIGKTLTAVLSIHNTGQAAFVFSGALHSYFLVDNISDVSISGLEQCRYIDALQDWQSYQQQGELSIDKETDRIYLLQQESMPISIRDKQRKITINSVGSRSAVVWNPWIEKSQGLSQFADDDYKKMLCIETANACDNVICLEPGQQHSLGVMLEV